MNLKPQSDASMELVKGAQHLRMGIEKVGDALVILRLS